ncbi:MAG: hypothetical protein GY868_09550 [Deltaproteobacteria bacterium]|nr:hypothetical protein [Deltaproteobacteria bacterium]
MFDYSSTGPFFIKPSQQGVNDFDALIDRDYQVLISKWLQEGWDIFRQNAGTAIAFAVVAGICFLVANAVPFVGLLVTYPVLAGFIIMALLVFQDRTAGFNTYLWGFRHFLPLLMFSIVSTVFMAVGFMLLVVPGVYLSVAYLFAPYLIVEKNIDFWPAMEISRKKVNRHFVGLLGFAVIIILINLVGCIPLFFGLFVTVPLTVCMTTAAYRDIFMEVGADTGTTMPMAQM